MPALRTLGGHRRYNLHALRRMTEESDDEARTENDPEGQSDGTMPRALIYTRVSSHRQANGGDLDRQKTDLVAYCRQRGYRIVADVHDIGSGINDARPGLLRLMRAVRTGACDAVVVRDADRLARFGTHLLRSIMNDEGVSLEIAAAGGREERLEDRVADDVIAVLTSFAGKVHRSRRGRVLSVPAT